MRIRKKNLKILDFIQGIQWCKLCHTGRVTASQNSDNFVGELVVKVKVIITKRLNVDVKVTDDARKYKEEAEIF